MKIKATIPPIVETTITGYRGAVSTKRDNKEYIIQFYTLDGDTYSHYKYFENGSQCISDQCPSDIETALFQEAEKLGWT
jgi:hypothetical protein